MLSTVSKLIRNSYQLKSNLEVHTLYSIFTVNKQSYCLKFRNHRSEEHQWRSEAI